MGADVRARLERFLAARLGGDLRVTALQRRTEGFSQETFVVDVDVAGTSRGYVVKREPVAGLLEPYDLEPEFRVLHARAGGPLPSPPTPWFERDPAVFDRPFYVMERLPGEVPIPAPGPAGAGPFTEAERATLGPEVAGALARLHAVDWRAAGLEFLGVPGPGTDFALREVAKWESLIQQSLRKPEPVLTEVLMWLKTNAPETRRLAFVHGAYRTGNLIIKDDAVAAIIDWELQVIGDPMYDVAYVLSDLNREGSPLLSCVVEREFFLDYYQQLTGLTVDLDVCRYYEVLYMMRSTAFWLSASGLFAEGKNKDLRLARTAYSVPVVLDMAAKALGF